MDMAIDHEGERELDKVAEVAMEGADAQPVLAADQAIAADAARLSEQLRVMRDRLYPPAAQKTLRTFSSGEAARLIGVSDGYLRQLSIAGEGPQPETGSGGRRYYSLSDINALRQHLAAQAKAKGNLAKARSYVKWRDPEHEHLQVISVTNFKGGSGKTTTSAHTSSSTRHRACWPSARRVTVRTNSSSRAFRPHLPRLPMITTWSSSTVRHSSAS